MTVRANKFTPEVLLSAPRRSAATPNSKGTLALFTFSTYSFESHSTKSEIRVLDISTGQSTVLTDDTNATEPTWIGEADEVLWLKGEEKAKTSLFLGDATKPSSTPHVIHTFKGPVGNLKIKSIGEDDFALAFTGLATPDGDLFNPEEEKKPYSSAKAYSSLFVRHWDSWSTANKNAIWTGSLTKSGDKYALRSLNVVNMLWESSKRGSPSLESPVAPFGGSGDFDICEKGIAFVAKDPTLDFANHTKTDLFYIPVGGDETPPAPVIRIETPGLKGYSASPVFSPDGKSLAFTRMKIDGYESDKPRLMMIPDLDDLSSVHEFFETDDGEGGWDLRPESITWSQDGKELYVTAEENGRGKLFKVPSSPKKATSLPTAITHDGKVSDVKYFAKGDARLFVSSSSYIDNSLYRVVDPSDASSRSISSGSKAGLAFGLSPEQVSEIWFDGAGGDGGDSYKVHAWVLKPSGFDPDKRYPLAYVIHGGPQGAWADAWSTRWNLAVFAEQGYVVVAPNPTGSTGYGMALQNGIREQWGGRPYEDLARGFEHVEKEMGFVDTARAVALGASYGGYMVNWMQGHALGRRFRALVTHDGVFSTLNQYASEELFFPKHDFGGALWERREVYERWDPARFAANWSTPHLIIHNELDYRLPISEGLAPFNVLQSLGVDSRFLMFPDENHWVLKPENSLVWHKEVLGWINKYSGIAAEQEELSKAMAKTKI